MKHSKGKWQAVKNSSWGESHKQNFGDKPGYVICHNDQYNQLSVIATVPHPLGMSIETMEANAALIADAPRLSMELDTACERLAEGRSYLMSVQSDEITVEDCLEAFGFGRNGLKNPWD